MYHDLLSDLVITKVHLASTIYTPQNTKVKRLNRSRWAVVIKYEGETVYFSNEKRFISNATNLVILPRGCDYDWQCTKAGHFCIIEFDSDLVYHEPLSFPVKNSEKLLKKFKSLEFKRNMKHPMMEMESIKDAYSIILSLAQSEPEKYLPNEKQQKIAPVLAYISQNYHKSLSNDQLAAQTGLSTVYFRKLFTQITGLSPIAYIHRIRIEKAKEMLKSDYGMLSDMAQSLGYSSLYDFSRDFKKHTGVSPSQYLKTLSL